jgi:rhodanese-related sulfurtransferase
VLVSTPEVEFDMDDVRAFYEERDRYQLVDVREPWEWQEGRIEGALLIPLNDLMAGAEQGTLDTHRPVALVCKSGNRSEVATLMLRARGYDAHNLEGGMLAWDAEGLPYSTPDGGPGRVA